MPKRSASARPQRYGHLNASRPVLSVYDPRCHGHFGGSRSIGRRLCLRCVSTGRPGGEGSLHLPPMAVRARRVSLRASSKGRYSHLELQMPSQVRPAIQAIKICYLAGITCRPIVGCRLGDFKSVTRTQRQSLYHNAGRGGRGVGVRSC